MKEIKRVFTVDGRPFFSVGGQANNSSGYGQEYEAAVRAVEAVHGNTLAIPITWEQIEPEEGQFDLSAVDTLLGAARDHDLHLVILWFATWKNGMMKYAPAWVKADPQRFHRAVSAAGHPLSVLSPHCTASRDADAAAFTRLLGYLREKDGDTGTVIAVQVENEPGSLGTDRDYGELGEADYGKAVPEELMAAMKAKPTSPVYAAWQAAGARDGGTWEQVFGWDGGEFMNAWHLARYIDHIAAAGKAVYDIPLYVNVWLGEQGFRQPGSYPAGGAVTKVLDIHRWASKSIDLVAPDIYLPHSEGYRYICAHYDRDDNPLYIPESGRQGSNAWHMFYALADYSAIGIHVFGIDNLVQPDGTIAPACAGVADSLRCVSAAAPLLLRYQGTGRVHAVVQEENQIEQYLDMDDYMGVVYFAGADTMFWTDYHHGRGPLDRNERGRGLVFQGDADEFYIVGAGFRLHLQKKNAPAALADAWRVSDFLKTRLINYVTVDEGHFDAAGQFVVDRHRTGDESDHGIWAAPDVGVIRVVMGE